MRDWSGTGGGREASWKFTALMFLLAAELLKVVVRGFGGRTPGGHEPRAAMLNSGDRAAIATWSEVLTRLVKSDVSKIRERGFRAGGGVCEDAVPANHRRNRQEVRAVEVVDTVRIPEEPDGRCKIDSR